jgi:hypothetical protein
MISVAGRKVGVDVGDVTLEPDQAAGPLQRCLVEFSGAVAESHESWCAGGLVPGNDHAGLVLSEPEAVRTRRIQAVPGQPTDPN